MPLRLTPRQWRAILRWFVRGVPSVMIAHETGLERKRVLRALTVVRSAMARSGPPGTKAIVKESALVGERLVHAGLGSTARSRARPSPPVIGLHAAQAGGLWADVIPEAEAEEFRLAVRGRKRPRGTGRSELSRYAALVYRGRFYRLGDPASARFGELEAFWAYVRHQLRAKGGIRRSRLGLYLSEYSWRYSHRRLTPATQLRDLVELLRGGHPVEGTGL